MFGHSTNLFLTWWTKMAIAQLHLLTNRDHPKNWMFTAEDISIPLGSDTPNYHENCWLKHTTHINPYDIHIIRIIYIYNHIHIYIYPSHLHKIQTAPTLFVDELTPPHHPMPPRRSSRIRRNDVRAHRDGSRSRGDRGYRHRSRWPWAGVSMDFMIGLG
jgi:hypothetical protein